MMKEVKKNDKRKEYKTDNFFRIRDGKTGKIKVIDGKITGYGKREAEEAKPV